MNKYSEALLQAFRITAQSEVNKFKYDKTAQSKILSVVDISKGEYEVEYQNNRITAYSLDLEKTYKKDENVLIKIPEGDLSNKIIIEGRVSTININSLALDKLRNSFYPVGQSFFNSDDILKLKAFKEKETPVSGKINLDEEFELNVTECEYLQIKAEFQTRFFGKHSTGSYGLIINFLTKDNSIYTVIFNSSDFIGDLYNFHQWTEQSKIISIPKNLISKISSASFVCENFKRDEECRLETEEDENLLCKNIEISFMNKVDLLEGGYYLYLQTPQGKFFNDNTSSLKIVANLLVNGENITNQSGCELKWEKLHLTKDNNWQKLENTGNSYDIKKGEAGDYSATYRVTASYKDITTSQEIIIYGINYSKAPKIVQSMDNKDIKLSLSVDTEQQEWFWLLSNGEYKRISEEKTITLKKENLLYDNMKIYCQIGNYVTSIVLSKPQTTEDVTVSFVGQDVYKYDANGAITQEDSDMKRTLNFNAIFKEGIAYNYSIKWYLGDIELTESPISPDNSMLSKVLVDKSGILFYNIRQKYERERTNNTIRVELTATNNKTYTFEKTIIFTKDGDQGTNGTSYVLRVFPIDDNNNEISGFWGLSFNQKGRLKAKLLKNGKDVEGNVVYNWEEVAGGNISSSSDKTSSIIKIESNSDNACIVQATAQYDEMSISNVYGVNVLTSGDISDYDISNVPNVIRYNSDGGNPSINSGSYNYPYTYNKKPSLTNRVTIPTNIFALEKKYQIVELKEGLYHPIIYHINRYGNEAINSWDGTTIKTENGTIIAPQIGAGVKDSDNSFTGFVIGKNTGNSNKVGLYGYSKGEQTFLLDENGIARFGTGDNGITIDGTTAKITGNDLVINLNNKEIYDKEQNLITDTSSLEKNTPVFDKKGKSAQIEDSYALYFKNNNFILDYMGKITAKSGNIGGWQLLQFPYELDSNKLTSCLKAGNTILYGDDRGLIETDHIRIKNQGTELGFLGLIEGSDGSSTTKNIGIKGSSGKGIVLETSKIGSNNIRLTANNSIYLEAKSINVKGDIDLLDSTIMINADQVGVIAGNYSFDSLTEYVQFLITNTGE